MKKTYIKPITELVGIKPQVSMLAASQGQWADAKPNNPNVDNLWDDDDEGLVGDDNTNWAGYKKNMSLW